MKFHISQLFSLTISLALLGAPLPMSAIEQEVLNSPIEKKELSNDLYIYLGKDLSDIGSVIARIKDLDSNNKSAIHELNKYIQAGFFLGRYESVLEALEQAETLLLRNGHTLNHDQLDSLVTDFNCLAHKVLNGELTIDSQLLDTKSLSSLEDADSMITRSSCPASCTRTLMVNEKMEVLCKATFKKNLKAKKNVDIKGKLKVGKKATFKDDVCIEGLLSAGDAIIDSLSVTDLVVASCMDNLCVNSLSVTDLAVASCMDSLCVNTLSVNDLIIIGGSCLDELCIETLSVNDLVVANCMTDLCVNNLSVVNESISGTLSVNNEIVTNLTATTISSTDAVIQNLTVANCMTDLCVNNLSVVNESISGTLSVNNEIVTNLTATTVSSTDAVIQNLTVANCMASLCVNNLSVVNESISGTLSVNNEIVNGNLTLPALTPAGVVHNSAAGLFSSSLIINADVDPAAGIVDTKLATIATPLKVSNSATTATTVDGTPNAIVTRNGAGLFGTLMLTLNSEAAIQNGGWIAQQGSISPPNTFLAEYIVPRDCIVTSLYARSQAAPGGGGNFQFTLFIDNIVAPLITVITDPNLSASTTGASIPVSAGQRLAVQTQVNAGASPERAIATLELRY